jgi:CubicO group peptidase (beta-lactamase class C family)
MTPDTLLGIGSITKSFTAFAIVKLEEMGKLALDDSAAKYLAAEPFLSRPEITLKHMLSHSTGIPSLDAGMLAFSYTFEDYSRIYPATHRADFLAHLADADEYTLFKPGEKFFYNNDMFTCLDFIIEAASGQSFADFIQQQLLTPLGMHRAVLTREAFANDPDNNVMTGYLPEQKDGKLVFKESDMPMDGYLHAPGGLYVSMNEMLNYSQCLLNGGVFNDQRLLSEASVAKLFKGEISTPYGQGEDPQYALGWSVEAPTDTMPHTVIHHGGGMGTSNSFLILVPDLKLSVVIAENAGTGITPLIARCVVAMAMDQAPASAVEDLKLAAVLDEIKGGYQSAYDLYSLDISQKGPVLQVDMETDDGRFSFPLLPKNLDTLEFGVYSLRSESKAQVQFYRDKDSGKVAYAAYDRFLYRRT